MTPLHNLLGSWWVVCLFTIALLMVVQSPRAYASSRGGGSGILGALDRVGFQHRHSADPPMSGLCETAVSIHGYKCQEFSVKTEDGYILSLQRISEGRSNGSDDAGKSNNNKPPVLLQHGLIVDGMTWVLNSPDESLGFMLADSGFDVWIANTRGTQYSRAHETLDPAYPDGMTWLMNSPDESLGFILADSGFDVWIANTRGTRYSRAHETLDPADPAYWNWSWDELAEYDLPATLDFIYRQAGGQKIHYVGHSMGTLVALASFSQGKLVDKVRSAALLSPVAYLSHMTTGLGKLAAKAFVGEIITLLGIAEFNPNGVHVKKFLKALCSNPKVDCYDLMAAITGKNCCLNSSTIDLFLKNEPQPTAVKNMVHLGHLAQTVRDGVLSKYNYRNPYRNIQHYGQVRPPVYDLTNIPKNLPIFISYGGRDSLADTEDVDLLLDRLKLHDKDKLTVQFVKEYAHADFIIGVTAKDIVYNSLVAFFKRQ